MNLWSSWKPSFLSTVFFPEFFRHFSNSRFKHDYLVNSTFARPVNLVPSAHLDRFFLRRDYTENFAPIGPSWALAHIQTAVPKLPGVWYMQLGLDFLPRVNLARHSLLSPQNYHNPKAAFYIADISTSHKTAFTFLWQIFARHERQNQEGKHAGMLSFFQR